jgi:hypothetical protein
MNTKLIIVEGLPGTGKTTTAIKINEFLKSKNISTNLFLEDDLHPADLAWHACIPKETFDEILAEYSEIAEDIKNNTAWNGEQAIVAFNKISSSDKSFYDEMKKYEIYNGKTSLDRFCNLLQTRWADFAENADHRDDVTIFESALMQSQINDLLAVRNCDKQTIFDHMKKLVKSIEKLNPIIIYLSSENIEETIRHIASERISNDAQPNWIDMAMGWVEKTSYGKAHGLKGFDGVIEFCKARKSVELGFLANTTAYSVIINGNNDYDRMWEDIKTTLQSAL